MKENKGQKGIITGILVLGSFCGLVEVAAAGLLHRSGIHFSGLLIGLDALFIGIAMAVYGNPVMILGMGLLACLHKQLVIPVLGLSVLCKANACLAVLLEFGGLAGMTALFRGRVIKSRTARSLASGTGVLFGSLLYYFIGMHVQPCSYMLSFNGTSGLTAFIMKEGAVWALSAGLFFMLGWEIGEKAKERTFGTWLQRPNSFYAGPGLLTLVSLLISAVIIYINK
ncbi:MAG: hypothetical protein PHF84_08550 [bacterium]|nr:hypothetical protein [bacterium]